MKPRDETLLMLEIIEFGYKMKRSLSPLIYSVSVWISDATLPLVFDIWLSVFGWKMKHSFNSRIILLLGVLISDKTLFLVFSMWLDGVWISDQTREKVSYLIHLIHSRKKVQKNEILISVKCVFISVLFLWNRCNEILFVFSKDSEEQSITYL